MTVQGNCVDLEMVNDYNYSPNSIVAVVSDSIVEGGPFRIGKVVSSIYKSNERVTKLTVHWYEMQKECNRLYGKYCPSYVHGKGKVKRRPWVDVITSEPVVVSFSSLKKNRTLPEAIHKKLHSEVVGQLYQNRK